jgi:hypothetical protein
MRRLRATDRTHVGYVNGAVALRPSNERAISERTGVWGQAIEVPGLATPTQSRPACVESVSCASAGNCAAGGSYLDSSGHQHGFVVSETNRVWGRAVEVPGLGALNKAGDAAVSSARAPRAAAWPAGTTRTAPARHFQGYVT